MKQLVLFYKKRRERIRVFSLAIMMLISSVLIGNLHSIRAAVSGGDLSGDVSSISGISQYDFETGRSSKDNQGISKEYSLRFFEEKQTPVITGNQSNYTGDDDGKHNGNGKAFFIENNEKGKVSARYTKLAEYTIYEGNHVKEVIPLDYKITAVDWEKNKDDGKHYITFGTTGGVGIKNLNWVRIRGEFYKSGTNTLVAVKGLITMKDIDDLQFVGIRKSEAEKIYINKKNTNLSFGTPTIGDTFLTLYNGNEGDQPIEDYRNMFAFTMSGTGFDYVFGTTKIPSGVDWMFPAENKYVFTEIPSQAPEKSISDEDEKKVTTNHVPSRLDSWTYHVEQEVPREDLSQNYWKSFQFEDDIEECLNIESVKVLDQDEMDVSNQFTITKTGQHVEAKAKNVKTQNFYDKTYSLRIQVKVKKEAEENFEEHGHYNETKTQLNFKNIATAKIVTENDSQEKKTNEVKTIVELPKTAGGDPGLDIKKSVKHYEWQAKDEAEYKVEVSQSNQDAVATDVKVSDVSMPDGLTLDGDSVKVSGVESYDFKRVDGGWQLTTGKLLYGEKIIIEFKAKIDSKFNGLEVVNTAKADAYAVPETTDSAKIYVNSPKLKLEKKANKKEYKLGDHIAYHLDLVQENEGCFMRNVVIEDEIQTPGVDLKEGSIAIRDANGKDITKECDITTKGNAFKIETHKNLVKGENSYKFEAETKISVTYEAEILDENLAGFDIVNVAKAPPTENTNSTVIREDEEIPSGGDETKQTVFVKGAELSIQKDSDQTSYLYGTYGIYTVIAKQLREDYTAKNVVLTDTIKEDGCKLDMKSIQVYYNEKDITKQCEIDGNDKSYKISTMQDLPFGSEIKVIYRVKFPKNQETKVHNKAAVKADNAQEKEANHVISLGKKGGVTTQNSTGKGTNNPKTGDYSGIYMYIILGVGAVLLGVFLVLKKFFRYN